MQQVGLLLGSKPLLMSNVGRGIAKCAGIFVLVNAGVDIREEKTFPIFIHKRRKFSTPNSEKLLIFHFSLKPALRKAAISQLGEFSAGLFHFSAANKRRP